MKKGGCQIKDTALANLDQAVLEEQRQWGHTVVYGPEAHLNMNTATTTGDDNPFAEPKLQPVVKVSVNMPTDEWLCKNMDKLNVTLVEWPFPKLWGWWPVERSVYQASKISDKVVRFAHQQTEGVQFGQLLIQTGFKTEQQLKLDCQVIWNLLCTAGISTDFTRNSVKVGKISLRIQLYW